MARATTASCAPGDPRRAELDDLTALARQPWTLRIRCQPVIVRPSSERDLAAVAQMHRRCSARSLLDRYRRGGRPPPIGAMEPALRNPRSYVAVTARGSVIATASVRRDPLHHPLCAETGLLVEDGWQRRGIGGELMTHLAGVAQIAGFTELIAYPATATVVAQRLMIEVGRTWVVPDANVHLHTYLQHGAALGLGAVRQRLAG